MVQRQGLTGISPGTSCLSWRSEMCLCVPGLAGDGQGAQVHGATAGPPLLGLEKPLFRNKVLKLKNVRRYQKKK